MADSKVAAAAPRFTMWFNMKTAVKNFTGYNAKEEEDAKKVPPSPTFSSLPFPFSRQ